MRPSFFVLTILLAACPVSQALAQSFPMKKCATPGEPLGYLTATGTVRYLLAPDGRPDTATVEVMKALQMSTAGFRSAAVRSLSACRMQVPKDTPGPLTVIQAIHFDSETVKLEPATTANDSTPPLPLTGPLPPDPLRPLEPRDPRLEERPRAFACKGLIRVERTMTSRELEQEREDQASRRTTRARVRLVVGPDGSVVPGNVSVYGSFSAPETEGLIQMSQNCRYAPGRVGGVPVTSVGELDVTTQY